MEKAAAYAISAFIVGFGLDPFCRPKLQCARILDLRCPHPHGDRAPERFRPHLKSIPIRGAVARPASPMERPMAPRPDAPNVGHGLPFFREPKRERFRNGVFYPWNTHGVCKP